MDDDQHRRVLFNTVVLIHVGNVPGDALAVLGLGVLDREGVDHLVLPEGLAGFGLHVHAGAAVVPGDVFQVGVGDKADIAQEGIDQRVVFKCLGRLEYSVVRVVVAKRGKLGARDFLRRGAGKIRYQPLVVFDMQDQRAGLDLAEPVLDADGRAAGPVAIDQVHRIKNGGLGLLAGALIAFGVPVEDFFLDRCPRRIGPEVEAEAGMAEHGPAERHALIRVFFLRQVVIIALGFTPGRVGFDGRRHQLKNPVTHRVFAVSRLGLATNRHDRFDEAIARMQQAPHIGLGTPHGNARGQLDLSHFQMIAQQAVIGLHQIKHVVLRKFHSQPVARLAGAPKAKGIEVNDVVAVGVEQLTLAHMGGGKRQLGEGLSFLPKAVHGRSVAGIVAADDDGVGDFALGIPLRRADGDIGKTQRPGAQGFERDAALAAVRPGIRPV
ncbi:MAG: hypothetical protein BWY57_02921 [Betaproteobacteria bacterium ADurb.Bin341]|nr:MAG: hypothetical protein BWY57_02921 [Betaproteobacteria bacterium ADurb.Bin341]